MTEPYVTGRTGNRILCVFKGIYAASCGAEAETKQISGPAVFLPRHFILWYDYSAEFYST
jgi:hypothetical protein